MKIIVGGGVSGLWLAAELKARGIHCCVLDRGPLGQGQTLASQGMIHGGTKYALNGLLTRAADVIGAMPKRWRTALNGEGSVNLSTVTLERSDQLLWSTDSMASNLVGFFASQAMRSRMTRIDATSEPAFGSSAFKGHLYRLMEPVLKLDTLIPAFQQQLSGQLFEATVSALTCRHGQVIGVETDQGALEGEVILTAGEGTEALLQSAGFKTPRMQRRPLAMGVIALKQPIAGIFGHQLGATSKPKITLSTHEIDSTQYLYVGGQVAEEGIDKTDTEQQSAIQEAVTRGLHWLDLKIDSVDVFRINRAEPDASGHRPDHAFVDAIAGCWVCWPTKLALAPALADAILPSLRPNAQTPLPTWPVATTGRYPWRLN